MVIIITSLLVINCNVKSKKFNKEEIDWILNFNLDKTLSERVILFKKEFNKTITKAYISKLSKEKEC
jgi:hypothetical protein